LNLDQSQPFQRIEIKNNKVKKFRLVMKRYWPLTIFLLASLILAVKLLGFEIIESSGKEILTEEPTLRPVKISEKPTTSITPLVSGTAVPVIVPDVPPTSEPDILNSEKVNLPYVSAGGDEFFLSPNGNDNKSGVSPSEAWATFDKAWSVILPGDILTLLDGTYYQSLSPTIYGVPGKPITIRAQNDGKAIIDGQGVRIPVHLMGWQTEYVVIEGIVAQNSSADVFYLEEAENNVLRRVSGYNANTDTNTHVITITGNNNLIEDCVAAGSGRKMILVFKSEHNIIRRCLVDWREWDGRQWHDCWPWGEGIELYNSSNNTIENSIAYGQTPRSGVSILTQNQTISSGNKILGTIAMRSGLELDGTPIIWGDTRPQPTQYTCVTNVFDYPTNQLGFTANVSGGALQDNLWQDILAWGNGRYGINFNIVVSPIETSTNNRIDRATMFDNGLNNQNTSQWGGIGAGANEGTLEYFASVQNSYIENIWQGGSSFTTQTGEGARLANRYLDGVLTNEPLWPWPMEDRIKAELGYSVTCRMGTVINDSYAAGKAAQGIDMTSRDPNWATDPNNLVVQACNNQ
jgi:hypothetical protein